METSVAVAVHNSHNQQQLDSCEYGSFCGINCRTFETALKSYYHTYTDDGKTLPFSHSPKTTPVSSSLKNCRKNPTSAKAMSVSIKNNLHRAFKSDSFSPISPRAIHNDDGFEKCIRNAKDRAPSCSGRLDFGLNEGRFSECWAGPAYNSSPAPSSLPIPKFSRRAKGTVSLDDLPSLSSDIDLHRIIIAKSAPSSPTRRSLMTCDIFDDAADSASKSLRRILNLDE